jgi:hypothetical protein
MFKAWSHSRLNIFEQCKLRAKLAFIDKIPEPPRPLPAGKTEHANDRGTRIHTAAELFVQGGVELIPELETFRAELTILRALYAVGKVSLEGEWAVDKDWLPCAWNSDTAWARIKLDAMVFLTPKHGVVIDYKSGKRAGNEVKHTEQGQLYQLAAFMRYPELEVIDVEFWYTDVDELHHVQYTKRQGLRYLKGYTARGTAMVTADVFPPSPSIFNCKWCPYGPTGTGHCDKGVSGKGVKPPHIANAISNSFVSWP